MPDFRFMLARFPDPDWEERKLYRRLRNHLIKLRTTRLQRDRQDLVGDETDPERQWDVFGGGVDISRAETARLERWAKLLVTSPRAKGDLAHLGRDELPKLEALRQPVRLVRIETEHHADEIAASLHDSFPWMAEATGFFWQAMRQHVREGSPGLRLPPSILDGPPGIGKSALARRLGDLLGTGTLVIECTGEAAGFSVVGVQKGWGSACPGRPLETIIRTRIANPVIVLDEIEKAGDVTSSKGQSHSLTDALLPLLEPLTAKSWTCPYFRVPFDMSQISWVMTANAAGFLPEHFLSRCRLLHVLGPSRAQVIAFARREGCKRGLPDTALDALAEALERSAHRDHPLNLRLVKRLLDKAADLEARPVLH